MFYDIPSIYLDRTEPLTDRPAYTLNAWLAGLPGANPSYQAGDLVSHDHFLHAFLSEEELRSELTEAGATSSDPIGTNSSPYSPGFMNPSVTDKSRAGRIRREISLEAA
jgi:hypothetical protein